MAQLVDEMVASAVNIAESFRRSSFEADETFSVLNSAPFGSGANTMVQPLHSHMLLYTQVSDSRQILFSMQCIKNIIQVSFFFICVSLFKLFSDLVRNPALHYIGQNLFG